MDLIVVGCGWAGERHVKAIQALERQGRDAHVAGLVDTDRDHLAAQAAAWRAGAEQAAGVPTTFTDLAAALEALPGAGAVVLATPHAAHRAGTEQAAAAGRHVLVEKPIALTLDDADAMLAACHRAGTTLMVAESVRYQRGPLAVRAALEAGRIGQVLSGHLNMIFRGRHTYEYPGRRAWLARPDLGGSGIWMLNGIHHLSMARMFLGEVARIDAHEVHSHRFRGECEATVVALVEFMGGAVVTMIVSAELHGYDRFGEVVLFGADGTLEARWHGEKRLIIYAEGADPETITWEDDAEADPPGQFVRQMEEFLAAIAERRTPFTDARSERATLAAVLAGYESIRTGRPVAPAPPP